MLTFFILFNIWSSNIFRKNIFSVQAPDVFLLVFITWTSWTETCYAHFNCQLLWVLSPCSVGSNGSWWSPTTYVVSLFLDLVFSFCLSLRLSVSRLCFASSTRTFTWRHFGPLHVPHLERDNICRYMTIFVEISHLGLLVLEVKCITPGLRAWSWEGKIVSLPSLMTSITFFFLSGTVWTSRSPNSICERFKW